MRVILCTGDVSSVISFVDHFFPLYSFNYFLWVACFGIFYSFLSLSVQKAIVPYWDHVSLFLFHQQSLLPFPISTLVDLRDPSDVLGRSTQVRSSSLCRKELRLTNR